MLTEHINKKHPEQVFCKYYTDLLYIYTTIKKADYKSIYEF